MQLAAAEGDARAHTCKKQLEQRPKASLTATNLRTVAVRRGHFDRCILLYIVVVPVKHNRSTVLNKIVLELWSRTTNIFQMGFR
uniref:Uncharacterized protein n=1 Tax=Panagrellus redivivus TaxID=6233 RepID=A0A7E4W3Y4_PANRE